MEHLHALLSYLAPGFLALCGMAVVWLGKRFLDRLDQQFQRIAEGISSHEQRLTRVETHVEIIQHDVDFLKVVPPRIQQ